MEWQSNYLLGFWQEKEGAINTENCKARGRLEQNQDKPIVPQSLSCEHRNQAYASSKKKVHIVCKSIADSGICEEARRETGLSDLG